MSGIVSFNDFSRLDLRIGKVVSAERVPGSKKLIRLQIDVGGKTRQSVAGLGDQYKLEALQSKLVAVVLNLEPRKLFGVESQVMLLAAIDGDKVSVLSPDQAVAPGSKVT
jgi:methionine--tRNA ligase beta chain